MNSQGIYVNRGIEAMCHFALARGTVSDVLAVVEVLYDNHHWEVMQGLIPGQDGNLAAANEVAMIDDTNTSEPPPPPSPPGPGGLKRRSRSFLLLNAPPSTERLVSHKYPIGAFYRYLINFEPQDQGISLKVQICL